MNDSEDSKPVPAPQPRLVGLVAAMVAAVCAPFGFFGGTTSRGLPVVTPHPRRKEEEREADIERPKYSRVIVVDPEVNLRVLPDDMAAANTAWEEAVRVKGGFLRENPYQRKAPKWARPKVVQRVGWRNPFKGIAVHATGVATEAVRCGQGKDDRMEIRECRGRRLDPRDLGIGA